jgi:hypothetical protein
VWWGSTTVSPNILFLSSNMGQVVLYVKNKQTFEAVYNLERNVCFTEPEHREFGKLIIVDEVMHCAFGMIFLLSYDWH